MMGYEPHSSYGQRETKRENNGENEFRTTEEIDVFFWGGGWGWGWGAHFTQWSEKATNCHEVILRIQNHCCSVIQVTQKSKTNLSM